MYKVMRSVREAVRDAKDRIVGLPLNATLTTIGLAFAMTNKKSRTQFAANLRRDKDWMWIMEVADALDHKAKNIAIDGVVVLEMLGIIPSEDGPAWKNNW